jgi:hypothetical protein
MSTVIYFSLVLNYVIAARQHKANPALRQMQVAKFLVGRHGKNDYLGGLLFRPKVWDGNVDI